MSTISAISSTSSTQGQTQAQKAQISKDMQALEAAIKSGNVKAAQAAMMQLAQDMAASSPDSAASSNRAMTDLAKVATALKSDDLTGAEKALSSRQGALNRNASTSGNSNSPDLSDLASSNSDGSTSFIATV
jgi:hypothetical protein